MNEVVACLATIPSRKKELRLVCESLLPQVDRLFIYFNNYKESEVPLWAKSIDKVEYETSFDGEYGDLGDVGKFYFCSEEMKDKYGITGLVFTCDDDIVYPDWYTKRTSRIMEYNYPGCLVSYHGSIILRRSRPYHANGTRRTYFVAKTVSNVTPVHVGGTGCMCFHTSTFRPSLKIFKHTNMSDIFVAKWANEQGIRTLVIPHVSGDFLVLDVSETIWDNSRDMTGNSMDRRHQTSREISSIRWPALLSPHRMVDK